MRPCSPTIFAPSADMRTASNLAPLAGRGSRQPQPLFRKIPRHVNSFTPPCAGPCFSSAMGHPGRHAMIYGGFEIQSFEAGRGLWHARIQRADLEPVVIDGLSFPTLEVGFAWSNPDAAIADAKAHIDRFMPRFGERSAELPLASTNPSHSRTDPAGDAGAVQLPGLQRFAGGPAHHPRPRGRRVLDHALHPMRRDSSGYRQGRAGQSGQRPLRLNGVGPVPNLLALLTSADTASDAQHPRGHLPFSR